MTDPLDALRLPLAPVDPDPAFARTLRARVERALLVPQEDPMPPTAAPPTAPHPAAGGTRPGDVVHAAVRSPDPDRAARFLRAVLGRDVRTGAHPTWRGLFLVYEVPDVDAAVEVVRAAGGAAGVPADHAYGRTAECVDDQGVPFAVLSGGGAPVDPPVHAELRVPDAGRARAFYGAVLGWSFAPGHEGDFWNATIGGGRTRLLTGLSGGHDPAVVVPTWTVPDLDAAVAAVRAAGGTAAEPRTAAYGTVADCRDDQGMALQLLSDRHS